MAHTDGLEIRTLYRVEGPESAKANTLVKYTLFSEDESGNLVDVDVHLLDGWMKGKTSKHKTLKQTLTLTVNLKPNPNPKPKPNPNPNPSPTLKAFNLPLSLKHSQLQIATTSATKS